MAHISTKFSGRLALNGVGETESLGRRIAAGLAVGDAIAFQGDLGAGKTTLARSILRALGVTDHVPSPTFTLVQEYETARLKISHCDLYRVVEPADVDELGLEDALGDGALLIEWPERARARIPSGALWIRIGIVGEHGRVMQLSGPVRWAQLLDCGRA